MEKNDILSLSREELAAELSAMGEKPFRAKQIYEWLHIKKVTDFFADEQYFCTIAGRIIKKILYKITNYQKKTCQQYR